MTTPFYTPAAAWTPPRVQADRIRETASRGGRWDGALVDSITSSALMRDVAIAELLHFAGDYPATQDIAARRAFDLYSWKPCQFAKTLAAAVTAPMGAEGNYFLTVSSPHGDHLADHIDKTRLLQGNTIRNLGELTETTALRFTIESMDGTSMLEFPAVAFGEPWNGFAAPLVDRQTLTGFLRATGQGHRDVPRPDGPPLVEVWSSIAPEDVSVIAPTPQGHYELSGYTLHRPAEAILDAHQLRAAVDLAVQAAQQAHQRAATSAALLTHSTAAPDPNGPSL